MPTKKEYKQIIKDKLSAESDKNQKETDGVSSTDQNTGPKPDVPITNK